MYGNYIYNSQLNDVTNISEETLIALTNNKSINESYSTEIFQLYQQKYLPILNNNINYIDDLYVSNVLDRNLKMIIIQLTQNCNLRCKYCAFTENDGTNRTHSNHSIKWKTVKQTIDFFHEHSIDSSKVTIGFYGGEPFLNYPILKKAVEYSKRVFEGRIIHFSVTTNATILNDEILAFLAANDFSVTISLDGPQRINDFNRVFANSIKGSFWKAKETIENIVNNYPLLAKRTAINMVIDPQFSIDEYKCIYDEIPEISKISVLATLVSDDGLKKKFSQTSKFHEQYEYEIFMERLQIPDPKRIGFNRERRLFENTVRQKMNQVIKYYKKHNNFPAGSCIPGKTKLFVDVNGVIYPCEKVSETIEALMIGDCVNGFNIEKVQNCIQISSLTQEECKSCWCFGLCSSCVKYCFDNTGFSKEKRLSYCKNSKSIAKDIIYWMISMKKHNEINQKY